MRGRSAFQRCCESAFILVLSASVLSAQELPAGHGCHVVNANGTDQNDDTQAFLTGINPNPSTIDWPVTYIPPGTYYLSNSVAFTEERARFFMLQGAGTDKTIIRLKANSPGFGDTLTPREVFFFKYSHNATHSVFLEHLTIEIEAGNPGAVAYRCGAHNGGGITDVVVRAAANSGYIGIDLRDSPGPEYLENVRVYGFQKGIYLAGGQYSVTMEKIHLEGQRVLGIHNVAVPLQINDLTCANACRGIQSGGAELMLFNARFTVGSAGQFAAVSTAPAVVRNLTIAGSAYTYSFGDAIKGAMKTDQTIDEYLSESVKMTVPSPARPLDLPVKNVPQVAWDAPANWGNITAMGGFQAAVDAGTRSTLFFPANSTPAGVDVHVNNSAVKRIAGFSRRYEGKVIFDNPDPNSVVIAEHLRFSQVEISTPGTVILKSFTADNIAVTGDGETYINDYCCGLLQVNGARVWARQLNTESSTTISFHHHVQNTGGDLVILGIKTEGPDGVLQNTGGARTNVFGGFIYPGGWFGMPDGPAFINDRSSIALFHNQLAWTYPTYIREIQGGTQEYTLESLQFTGSCAYVSNPTGSAGTVGPEQRRERAAPRDVRLTQGNAVIAGAGNRTLLVTDTRGRIVARPSRGLVRLNMVAPGTVLLVGDAARLRPALTSVCE